MTGITKIPSVLLTLLILLLLSCEEKTEWDLDTNLPKVIVVEGVLTNERKAHEVRISRPMTDPNGIPQPVSGALVIIYEATQADNVRAYRLQEARPGIYLTDSTVMAEKEKMYRLYILYQGQQYHADSYMFEFDHLKSLKYRKIPGQEHWYELILEEARRPAMTEIHLNWGHLPGFRDLPAEQTRAHIIYYTVKSVDVNKIFKPDRERVPFPVGTIAYRRQYSMNPWQEDFVRTLMAETEWRGGLFDVQPGNVRSNFKGGAAVGYFSVSQVVSDSTLILPK